MTDEESPYTRIPRKVLEGLMRLAKRQVDADASSQLNLPVTVANAYTEGDRWDADDLLTGGYRRVMNPLYGGYTEGFDRSREYLFLRRSWAEPQKFRLCDQGELFNIAGLYWKPI